MIDVLYRTVSLPVFDNSIDFDLIRQAGFGDDGAHLK